jgi:hypothetical protein
VSLPALQPNFTSFKLSTMLAASFARASMRAAAISGLSRRSLFTSPVAAMASTRLYVGNLSWDARSAFQSVRCWRELFVWMAADVCNTMCGRVTCAV